MEQFSKEFNGSDLQFTPEQMEDLQKKLDQLQKDLQSPHRQVAPY
jgi:hypothetical protein